MCFKKKKPVLDVTPVKRSDFLAALSVYGIKPISKDTPLDPFLNLATKDLLDSIAPSLVYPADWYVDSIWDCEDFALQAQLDAGRLFGVSVRLCLGWAEEGYHGFVVALDRSGKVWVMENNAGFPWAGQWHEPARDMNNISEGHYLPKKVFI